MRFVYSFLLVCSFLYALEPEFSIENTNIITSNKNETIDYNRLRINLTFEDEKHQNSIIKIIADNYNIYNKTTPENYNESLIYRGYYKYIDDKHLFSIGLQRIPFGVGRIWNPIDIFNPINSTAIETGERKATESVRYEYAINSLSNIDLTYSKYKSAFRIKSYLDIADIAFIVLNDNKLDQDIIGYELEGEFLDSGIELRSEGGYFKDKNLDKTFYKYILGGEYGFENSLTILGEYKYESKTKSRYLGSIISYQINLLLNLNILGIKNLEDKSYVVSPNISYSLSDEATLTIGIFNYNSDDQSEFSSYNNYGYMKFYIHF